MIITVKRSELNGNKNLIREEVKKRLNGETPDNIVCETRVVGEDVEIKIKL